MLKKLLFLLALPSFILAHLVEYKITQNAVALRVADGAGVGLNTAFVEIFSPNGSKYAYGNTDLSGGFAFVPNEQGAWKAKISIVSDHGNHLQTVEIKIDENFKILGYTKPVYERFAGWIGAFGAILGVFGVIAVFKARRAVGTNA